MRGALRDHAAEPSVHVQWQLVSERLPVSGVVPAGRYRVLRKIHAGPARGAYEAEDRERGERVVLATFEANDAQSCERFRVQFDQLRRIAHPSLLKLHDLHLQDNQGFFTTELVEGVDFVSYSALQGPRSQTLACDENKLRATLPQLAAALHTLHRANRLHRDTVPSNVLVTDSGRVVVCHTNLLREDLDEETDTNPDAVSEVLAYMSPEQAESWRELDPASDWYRFGAILYRALSGRPPFTGNAMEQLVKKRDQDPPTLASLVREVPEDLERLCMALLSRDAAQRPGGERVLAELGVASTEQTVSLQKVSSAIARLGFVGRRQELARLQLAFDTMRAGSAVLALVVGREGMGKTALVEELLAGLTDTHPEAFVVELAPAHAHPRPARAVEPLLECLRRGERPAEPRVDEQALLERLTSWSSVEDERERGLSGDLEEVRSRTLRAQRETLCDLAVRRRVIIAADDADELDADSLVVLRELLRAPDAPAVMLVLCVSETPNRELERLSNDECTMFRVEVGPLSDEESKSVLGSVLGSADSAPLERIVELGHGCPLLLDQLARHFAAAPDSDAPAALEPLLDARLDALPESARRVLEVLSMATEPVPAERLREASRLTSSDLEAQIHRLLAERWVRDRDVGGAIAFDLAHAAIRRRVAARAGERRRELHRALLTTGLDPETVAVHALAAEDAELALGALTSAARRALASQSFARAATYLELVLERGTHDEERSRALRAALGEALALSARAAEAAQAFTRASHGAEPATSLALRQRAAEQLLLGGHFAAGLAALEALLAEVGVRLARAPWIALLGMLLRRLWLRIRGYGFRARSEHTLAESDLRRLDVLRFAAATFSVLDIVRAAHLALKHVLLALRLGEPARVAQSLAMHAVGFAIEGNAERAQAVLHKARAITVGARQPWLLATAAAAEMMMHFAAHNAWRLTRGKFEEVEGFLLASARPTRWELDASRTYACVSLRYLAEYEQLYRELSRFVAECERRGDVYGAVQLRIQCNTMWLARDDPKRAEQELDHALATWVAASPQQYHLQHFLACNARCEIELYRGRPAAARRVLEREMPALRRSLLMRLPTLFALLSFVDGRIALAEAALEPHARRRNRLIRHALAAARRLSKSALPMAAGFAGLLRATAAELTGSSARAQLLLREAITDLERTDTMLYSFAARRRLGHALGGRDGEDLIEQTTRWAEQHGIRNPERMTEMLAPAWPDAANPQ